VTDALPLFPLGTVLFPGLVLPLRAFEERYRALVRDLLARPNEVEREFGVVAIRRGWEVAEGPMAGPDVALYEVGCTAVVRRVTERPDGTYDLVTVGGRRFEIARLVEASTPYQQAEVRYLPESAGPEGAAERLGPRVLAAFRAYLRGLSPDQAGAAEQLPEDPLVLSHLVAATAMLTVADRQALLAIPDTAGRLRAELALLHREVALLGQVRAVPLALSELPVQPGPN
jgi:Lon protease-like protein